MRVGGGAYLEVEDGGIDVWCVGVVDGVWAAGENNTFGFPGELRELLGAGEHFGVDIELTETAGD